MAARGRLLFSLQYVRRLLQASNIDRTRLLSTSVVRLSQPQTAAGPLTLTTQEGGIRTICLNDLSKRLRKKNSHDNTFPNFLEVHLEGKEGLYGENKGHFLRAVATNCAGLRNALSLAMLKSLHNDLISDQDSLRVIIIKAKGPVFSAGHDLKELTREKGSDYHEEVFSTCTNVMNLIQDLAVPVIAQVNGLATAAGCQLVATCDIAVASSKSQFATPGVNVGLFCTTPGVAVGRSVPRKVAMEMLFTGHPINAHDALLHGLVSRVVPEEQVEEVTMKIAERICETSRSVVALGKAAFYAQIALESKNAYRYAEKMMVKNLTLEDGQEGIEAFIQKRKPGWTK